MLKDWPKLNKEMIEDQLKYRGISNPRVIAAIEKVPRHIFVSQTLEASAYGDFALPIGEGQTISQPYMVALMTQSLGLHGGEKVLEVGTGSGYQAAILAELSKKVITVERVKTLADKAENLLKSLGYENIEVIVGDGTEGYRKESPYDGIIVTAGCPKAPEPLVMQLAEGGRLVAPIGDKFSQILTIIEKKKDSLIQTQSVGCMFVPLIGKYGWT